MDQEKANYTAKHGTLCGHKLIGKVDVQLGEQLVPSSQLLILNS